MPRINNIVHHRPPNADTASSNATQTPSRDSGIAGIPNDTSFGFFKVPKQAAPSMATPTLNFSGGMYGTLAAMVARVAELKEEIAAKMEQVDSAQSLLAKQIALKDMAKLANEMAELLNTMGEVQEGPKDQGPQEFLNQVVTTVNRRFNSGDAAAQRDILTRLNKVMSGALELSGGADEDITLTLIVTDNNRAQAPVEVTLGDIVVGMMDAVAGGSATSTQSAGGSGAGGGTAPEQYEAQKALTKLFLTATASAEEKADPNTYKALTAECGFSEGAVQEGFAEYFGTNNQGVEVAHQRQEGLSYERVQVEASDEGPDAVAAAIDAQNKKTAEGQVKAQQDRLAEERQARRTQDV